jgi:hypothetical protein
VDVPKPAGKISAKMGKQKKQPPPRGVGAKYKTNLTEKTLP